MSKQGNKSGYAGMYCICVTNEDGTRSYWGPEYTAQPYRSRSSAYSAARRRFPHRPWRIVNMERENIGADK